MKNFTHLATFFPRCRPKARNLISHVLLTSFELPKHSKSFHPPPICISHQTIACFQMKTREVYKKIQLLYGKHGSGNKRLHLFLMRFVPVKIIRKTFRTQHEWNMMWWNVSDSGVRRKLCRKTSGGDGIKMNARSFCAPSKTIGASFIFSLEPASARIANKHRIITMETAFVYCHHLTI